jgi:hypothetical protein
LIGQTFAFQRVAPVGTSLIWGEIKRAARESRPSVICRKRSALRKFLALPFLLEFIKQGCCLPADVRHVVGKRRHPLFDKARLHMKHDALDRNEAFLFQNRRGTLSEPSVFPMFGLHG